MASSRSHRWGPDDERGALNLIEDRSVLSALSTVQAGRIVELGGTIGPDTPMPAGRPVPTLVMTRDGGDDLSRRTATGRAPKLGFADDLLVMAVQTGTHVDGLCHVFSQGKMYNGFDATEVRSGGARRCGIEKMGSVVTSGALLDVSRELQSRGLDGNREISVADLEAAMGRAGLTGLPAGAAVLIRTGWPAAAPSAEVYTSEWPGIGIDAARWLLEQDVAIVGADTVGVEVSPSRDDGSAIPVHELLVAGHGVYMVELLELDELARAEPCLFAFVMTPLALVGGTGSPVRPIAIL